MAGEMNVFHIKYLFNQVKILETPDNFSLKS